MAKSNFKGNGGGMNGANIQPVTPLVRQGAVQQTQVVTRVPGTARFAETGNGVGYAKVRDGQNTTTKSIAPARQFAETAGKKTPNF